MLDTWLEYEKGTPGFNFFKDKHLLIKYLPRFKVRAPDLYICEVECTNVYSKEGSNYFLAHNMMIPSLRWVYSETGAKYL